MTQISIVAAASSNDVIGKDNKLLWDLPDDLAMFKRITMGFPMVMGRKTFESLPGVLPGRIHIVLTTNKEWRPEPSSRSHLVKIVYSLEELMQVITAFERVTVIGGGKIYQLLLPYAQTVYLTRVYLKVSGDAYFPRLSPKYWLLQRLVNGKQHNGIDYAFHTFKRIKD